MKYVYTFFLPLTFLFVATLSTVTSLRAEDWPQWQGPNRTNISNEKGLLQQWPEGGPKQVWVSRVAGLGYSGMAVVGKTVYTMGARADGEFLIALDATTGKEKWSQQIGAFLMNRWGDGPRGTPTVDRDRVYALSGQGVLICANASDGAIRWQSDAKSLGGRKPGWGYCESVLVDDEKVVWTPGGKQGAVVAMNKMTGDTIWQSKGFTDGAQYSSIITAEIGGRRQYVQLVMKQLVGLDAKTGEQLWQTDWPGRTAVIPTPIYHDGRVYVSSGYGVGCKQVAINNENEVEEVFVNRVMKNHHGGVVRLGDYLYGYSDGPGWACQRWDDGEQVWAEKRALGKGSLTFADGRLYLLDERKGNVVLLDPNPDGWSEKGRFTLSPQTELRKPSGRIWTHPTVANGRLYLRDQELIMSYDISAK